ncbi:hypothetical protein [Pseudomonas sp. ZL2]
MSSRSERVIKQMLCALPCTAPQVPMAHAPIRGRLVFLENSDFERRSGLSL